MRTGVTMIDLLLDGGGVNNARALVYTESIITEYYRAGDLYICPRTATVVAVRGINMYVPRTRTTHKVY